MHQVELPREAGFYLWFIFDLNYLKVGCVHVLADTEKQRRWLIDEDMKRNPSSTERSYFVYMPDLVPMTMYAQAVDQPIPCHEGYPAVDGFIPFDLRMLDYLHYRDQNVADAKKRQDATDSLRRSMNLEAIR